MALCIPVERLKRKGEILAQISCTIPPFTICFKEKSYPSLRRVKTMNSAWPLSKDKSEQFLRRARRAESEESTVAPPRIHYRPPAKNFIWSYCEEGRCLPPCLPLCLLEAMLLHIHGWVWGGRVHSSNTAKSHTQSISLYGSWCLQGWGKKSTPLFSFVVQRISQDNKWMNNSFAQRLMNYRKNIAYSSAYCIWHSFSTEKQNRTSQFI